VRNSIVNTVSVPIAGSTNPATLYLAADKPMRMLVRNTGPNLVFLSFESSTLVNNEVAGVAGTYQLPPLMSDTFVLAPKQGMYAVGFGGGSQVSMAVSEAIPMTWAES
jgi:hypothetical protein